MLSDTDKREVCSIIMKDYGIQLNPNDEFFPLFYTAYKSGIITEKKVDELKQIISGLKSETARAKGEKLQVASGMQAFMLGFGSLGLPLLVGFILLFAVWFIINGNNQEVDKRNLAASLLSNSAIIEGKISDTSAVKVFRLYPATDIRKAKVGENYVYSKSCDCIEIPLVFRTWKK